MLDLTWDFRTFSGEPKITQFLDDRLVQSKLQSLRLKDEHLGPAAASSRSRWINAMFEFQTDVSNGSGIVRLVLTADGEWKAHVVYTDLESLKSFPEKVGPLKNPEPNHGLWKEKRRREREVEDGDPTVLIIGAGQTGLEGAARLKHLDVSSSLVERVARLGDNWRNQYEAFCLHDPELAHVTPALTFLKRQLTRPKP